MQSQSRPRQSTGALYDSLSYTKKELPYEELGIHTKSPPGHAFIEPTSNISGLALENSNIIDPKKSIKRRINDEEQREEQSRKKTKQSNIRALLRSQVMHAHQK